MGFLTEKNNEPTPVRAAEVNKILGTMDELTECGEELLTPFLKNENVKVISGPFSGFTGVIEEVNTEKKKLKVMVMIFGRKTSLELSFTQVEKE
jgi:transcriptional antiterminator NusG